MRATAVSSREPGFLDRLDLALLRLAKRRRDHLTRPPDFYEAFFTDDDVRKSTGDVRHAWRFGVVRRVYDRLFPEGADAVDVGCGLGACLLYLPENARFVGVDVSARSLAAARARSPEGAEFRRGGFPSLPTEPASFDFAVCLEVLEHVEDDEQAASELGRILRPGGYLLVSVPRTHYWSEYRRLIGHLRHYTAASLDDLVAAAGFEVVERIPQFARLWRAYHYLYLGLRTMEIGVRGAGRRGWSIFDSAGYRRLSARLLRRLEARSGAPDPASTFVLYRKATS